jgi:hypothetical protein
MNQRHGEGGGHGPQPVVPMGKWITKPIKIKVKKKGVVSGKEIECDILPDDPGSNGYVTGNKIKLPKDDGPFRIQFKLDGLEWDEDNPFNTSRNGCPPAGGKTNDDAQIFLQPATQNSLTILNLNDGDECQIHYRMNFADGTYCDPIMDNGGRT